LDTQSVSTGKRESLPDGLLEQFSFEGMDAIDLPAFYHATNDNQSTASLQALRADALNRLSVAFQHATQS